MSQNTIQTKIEQIRNETQLYGNTRGRVADLLTMLNTEKLDKAGVQGVVSEIVNLAPEFLEYVNTGQAPIDMTVLDSIAKTDNFAPNNAYYTVHQAFESGSYTNWKDGAGNPVVIDAADVSQNFIFFFVKDGTVQSIGRKPLPTVDINSVKNYLAVEYFKNGQLTVVGNIFDKNAPYNADKYFFNAGGAEGDLSGWSTSGYMQVKPNTTYSNSSKRFTIFYDENFNYVGSDTVAGAGNFTTNADTHYIRVDFQTASKDSLVIIEGDVYQAGLYMEYNKANYSQILEPEWKRIVVSRNADNFNSIRELANNLMAKATYWNRYEVYVPVGEWIEMDWQGWGDYVKIVGQNMLSTVIKCDGMSQNPNHKTDDLFPYASMRNKTFKEVWDMGYPRFLHIVFLTKNCHVENVKMEIYNGKYVLHGDNPFYKKAYFKNVYLKQRSSNYVIGNGINGGQSIILENFVIDNDPAPLKTNHGIYHHTWGNQKKGSLLSLINGSFKNCGYIYLGEAGSEQQDDVILDNCKADIEEVMFGVPQWTLGKSLWQNEIGDLETNPTLVPYCIYVWAKGTKITSITDSQDFPSASGAPFGADVRPNRANYVI